MTGVHVGATHAAAAPAARKRTATLSAGRIIGSNVVTGSIPRLHWLEVFEEYRSALALTLNFAG
uniref:Uncharacterized protein n=1 Tax=Bradyrhizobium quebecense TaxID=2748629 RepID=A0ABS3MER7_9BRAD